MENTQLDEAEGTFRAETRRRASAVYVLAPVPDRDPVAPSLYRTAAEVADLLWQEDDLDEDGKLRVPAEPAWYGEEPDSTWAFDSREQLERTLRLHAADTGEPLLWWYGDQPLWKQTF